MATQGVRDGHGSCLQGEATPPSWLASAAPGEVGCFVRCRMSEDCEAAKISLRLALTMALGTDNEAVVFSARYQPRLPRPWSPPTRPRRSLPQHWALSSEEECAPYHGDVIAWADMYRGLRGQIQIAELELCRSCPEPDAPTHGDVRLEGRREREMTSLCTIFVF